MDCLGRATCTVHSISAQDQPRRKGMYHYIKKLRTTVVTYILWPLPRFAFFKEIIGCLNGGFEEQAAVFAMKSFNQNIAQHTRTKHTFNYAHVTMW